MKGISALWEKELHLRGRRKQLLTQEVSIYGISVKKRVDIVIFVRMNLYISEAKEARTTKFCENMSYLWVQLMRVIESHHAHLRPYKSITLVLQAAY